MLFLSLFTCHSRFCWTFQAGMTAHKWMIDLCGGCSIEINYHIFLSLIPLTMRTRKQSFIEDVSVSTNDYNATFVKWDDLAHHRTSSILIETSARYLISLYGSQIPASQNNSEGNRRWVGIWNSWSFILQHMELCALYQFVDDDVFWRKNCPFKHLSITVWNADDNGILENCGLLWVPGIRWAQTLFSSKRKTST